MVQPLGDLFNGAVQGLVQPAARMKVVQISRHQFHPLQVLRHHPGGKLSQMPA